MGWTKALYHKGWRISISYNKLDLDRRRPAQDEPCQARVSCHLIDPAANPAGWSSKCAQMIPDAGFCQFDSTCAALQQLMLAARDRIDSLEQESGAG